MSSATPQQSGSTRDQALRRTRASQPRFFLLCGLRGARRWCLSMGFFKRPHLQPSPEEVDVAEIRREWGVPPMFEIRAPGPNDRASQPPPGFIVVFLDIWRDGFRVPIPAFQQQLLQAWDCRPCHLLPNAWRMISGFHRACLLADIEPEAGFFQTLFQCSPGNEGGFSISAQPGRKWLKTPSSTHLKRSSFVYVAIARGDFRIDITWTRASFQGRHSYRRASAEATR